MAVMKTMTDRWKGGFFAMMLLSGFVGWLVSSALGAFKVWQN